MKSATDELEKIRNREAIHVDRRGYRWAGRLMDICGACVGILIGLPLLIVASVVIRIDSRGPAIFRQTRIGLFGKPFTIYKLRGMYVDARDRFPHLYAYRYTANEIGGLRFHSDNDPRVTRVGRHLRRTSIDELPNLWNVLKGDMSLVGPRPEIPEMLPYYGGLATVLLSVKPGLTSLAKVSGRDQVTFEDALRYELEYVNNQSLRLDFKILWRTAVTLWRDGWVRE